MKYLLLISGLLALMSCASNQTEAKRSSDRYLSAKDSKAHDNNTSLSYIRAYLLIGNIEKAEEHFSKLKTPELISGAALVLAELQAAKGNSLEAQTAFLLALADPGYEALLNKEAVSLNLLDYFCAEKKWPALQGYGVAIINTANDDNTKSTYNTVIKNKVFTKIGLCFFYQQRWDDTKYWLEQVELNEQVIPLTYLALARANIEQQLYSEAQNLISQYERMKVTIDAQSLWASIEVYLALKQPNKVTQVGENMRSLFPYNQYTRKYILLTKRGRIKAITDNPRPSPTAISTSNTQSNSIDSENNIHIIEKGENLYQLSKRYGVSIPELQSWNPSLVVENISVGTKIRISRSQ